MRTYLSLGIIMLSLFSFSGIKVGFAVVPVAPPITSSAPAGGFFSQYFLNMSNNPCATVGQAITGYDALPGNTYLTPNCSYLFWLMNGAGEIEYTGNTRIIGNLGVTGEISTSNIITSTINGTLVSSFVRVPNFTNLTPGRIPKAIASLNPNSLGDSQIYENFSNIGIGNPNPTAKLDVNGNTKTSTISITAGASAGAVLTSTDAGGNTAWKKIVPRNCGWVGHNTLRHINDSIRYRFTCPGNKVVAGMGSSEEWINDEYHEILCCDLVLE